jgi:fructokinase
MRKIYAIGETVLDILFKDDKPLAATAGGAMLNTAVSLGRLNVPVEFISEYGTDRVGAAIDSFIRQNNVSSRYVYRYKQGKSAIAMAFLDEDNNAEYEFYKHYPDKRLQIEIPEITEQDIVLFGSFFSITKDVRNHLIKFINQAKQNNAIIIYDPNFRRSHLPDLPNVRSYIIENMMLADIIRGSDEDFNCIFDVDTAKAAFQMIHHYCNTSIYTASKKGVYLYSVNIEKQYKVPQIQPKSTIAAGDNFNAGLIYGILKHNLLSGDIAKISEQVWDDIIQYAIDFSQNVCMQLENYISNDFAEKI